MVFLLYDGVAMGSASHQATAKNKVQVHIHGGSCMYGFELACIFAKVDRFCYRFVEYVCNLVTVGL